MTKRPIAIALPDAAPQARTDWKVLTIALIALQVLIVAFADRAVDKATNWLHVRVPDPASGIVVPGPQPRAPTKLAQA